MAATQTIIRYGMRIRLRHRATGALLSSLDRVYQHAGTSGQQIVGGSAFKDDKSVWLIKPAHEFRTEDRNGQEVSNGDNFRLEHVATQKNLHTHTHPAPLTGASQFEVTAYTHAGPGDGDVFDNWSLLGEGGKWKFGVPFRLRHTSSGRLLHSHGAANLQLTAGLYEVTTVVHGDLNDLFECVSEDQPDRDAPAGNKAVDRGPQNDEDDWRGWLKQSVSRHLIAILSYSIVLVGGTWAVFNQTFLAISDRELAATRNELDRSEKQRAELTTTLAQTDADLKAIQSRVGAAAKRRLTQEDITHLSQQLTGEASASVFVSYHRGDPAGDALAGDISRALEKAGLKASTGYYDEFSQDHGIWLEVPARSFRPAFVQHVVAAFRSLGIELQLRLKPDMSKEQDLEIHITN